MQSDARRQVWRELRPGDRIALTELLLRNEYAHYGKLCFLNPMVKAGGQAAQDGLTTNGQCLTIRW